MLGFRLHDVQGRHGAHADLDLVLFEELRGQGQALALGLQVVDGVEEVVIHCFTLATVLTTVWRNVTSEISRFFFAILIWVRRESVLKFRRNGWLRDRLKSEL